MVTGMRRFSDLPLNWTPSREAPPADDVKGRRAAPSRRVAIFSMVHSVRAIVNDDESRRAATFGCPRAPEAPANAALPLVQHKDRNHAARAGVRVLLTSMPAASL